MITEATIHGGVAGSTGPEAQKGKGFRIVVHDQRLEHLYVQEARLNGRVLRRTHVEHAEIVAGGVLEFFMGRAPNKEALGALSLREAADAPASAENADGVSRKGG
jgi:putative alpha-1,2-mannosidase